MGISGLSQLLIAVGLLFWAASALFPAGRTATIAVACVMFALAVIAVVAGSAAGFAP